MLRYRKNALTGVTRETIRFVLRHWASYAIFLALALCAFMAIEILLGEAIVSDEWSYIFGIGLPLTSLLLTALATAFFAVPLHNFIIKGTRSYIPLFIGRLSIFAGIEALLSILVFFGLDSLVNSITGSPDIIIAALLLILSMGLGVILTTVLPYVAITSVARIKIGVPLSLSGGYRWSIFARLLRLSVILGAIKIGGGRLLSLLPPHFLDDDTIVGYYVPLIVENLWISAATLMFVTLASMIYLRLSEHKSGAVAHA